MFGNSVHRTLESTTARVRISGVSNSINLIDPVDPTSRILIRSEAVHGVIVHSCAHNCFLVPAFIVLQWSASLHATRLNYRNQHLLIFLITLIRASLKGATGRVD